MMRHFHRFPTPNDPTNGAKEFRKKFSHTKERIVQELLGAEESGELQLRGAMRKILFDVLDIDSHDFMFVTTNWDRVSERQTEVILNEIAPTQVKAFHLHGSIYDSESLYLPSEESFECYRSDERNEILGGMHLGLMESLASVEHLVLYGLSMSPLDAELAQILSVGVGGGALKKATIIAPDHQEISSRLRLLLKEPVPEVVGIDPTR